MMRHPTPAASRTTTTSRQQGFTLIELMVTITVAGVLMMVAVPSFNAFIQAQRVRTAISDFSSMMLLARSEAIKRNGEVTVASETGGWANGFVIRVGDTVVMRQSAFGGIQVTNTDTSLIYTNTGRLKNGATAFDIQHDVNRRCMRIDPSGMPVAREGTCT